MTCTDCRVENADCLTADRVRVCSDCLYERVIKERDEARAEVERLKESNKLLRVDADKEWGAAATAVATAYQRGAEAMREAAAKTFECNDEGGCFSGRWADKPCLSCGRATDVRALPVPEDK